MLLDRVRDRPSDANCDHSDGPRGWLRVPQRRCVVALALSSALAAVVPLALATPPDPVSVDGMYDAADYDDVVQLVTSQEVLVEGCLPVVSLLSTGASILPKTSEGISTAEPRSAPSRAPPKI